MNTEHTTVDAPVLSRRARKKRDTKNKLVHAAQSLMAEHGYAGVTIEAICEAADLGSATFFNYFPTKASMLRLMQDEANAIIIDAVNKMAAGPVEKLRAMPKLLLKTLDVHKRYYLDMASAFLDEERNSFRITDTSTGLEALIVELVQEGQAQGQMRADVDPDLLAMTIVSAWQTQTIVWSRGQRRSQTNQAMVEIVDLVLSGAEKRQQSH